MGRHCDCCCLIPVSPHMLTKIQKLGETREEATPMLFQPGCEASSEEELASQLSYYRIQYRPRSCVPQQLDGGFACFSFRVGTSNLVSITTRM